MTVEENKEIVRRYVEEGFNEANMAALDELSAPDFVNHDPGNPAVRDLAGPINRQQPRKVIQRKELPGSR